MKNIFHRSIFFVSSAAYFVYYCSMYAIVFESTFLHESIKHLPYTELFLVITNSQPAVGRTIKKTWNNLLKGIIQYNEKA